MGSTTLFLAKMGLLRSIIMISLLYTATVTTKLNFTASTPEKQAKQFSLFSVVQFPNEVCSTTSGTYSNGTCITASECSGRGGTAQGSCAAGFGVCCIYTFSESGSRISRNVSYIVNPSYPSTYVPTSTPTTLTYTIEKCSCDVCRLRLDYEVFQLTTGNTNVGATINTGACNVDYLLMTTTAHTVSTVTTGNYGSYPLICGTNGGLHSYLDMSCTCGDTATLNMEIGDATDNLWRIRVTQISCDNDNVANQEGCFQYFTGTSGTITSYGLQSDLMLASQNYAVCIRPEEGMCCIEYTATTWEVARGSYDNLNANALAAMLVDCVIVDSNLGTDPHCAGAFQCYANYVIIPYVKSSEQVFAFTKMVHITQPNGYDRFCGSKLTPQGWVTAATQPHSPVISCEKPFRLMHVTGVHATSGVGANANNLLGTDSIAANTVQAGVGLLNPAVGTSLPKGFQLEYKQLPGNC